MKKYTAVWCLVAALLFSAVSCRKSAGTPDLRAPESAAGINSTVSEEAEASFPAPDEENLTAEDDPEDEDDLTDGRPEEPETSPAGEDSEFSRALAKKNQEYREEDTNLTGIRIEPCAKKVWTVMVYMIGSNLESSLGAASSDLSEMTEAGINFERSNLVVYTGGSARWQSDIPCDRNSVLDLSKEGKDRMVASTEKNADMGAKETLAGFVNFCSEYYPAEHTALILWDHGGGPLWGYGSDELFSGDGLLLSEMELAMNATEYSGLRSLDFVGFDACLMGCLENMMLWSQFADYMVASEELEPGDGWDYGFLKLLNESDDPVTVTSGIVSCFRDYYAAKKTDYYNPDLTLSVCDLSRVQPLVHAVSDTALQMSEMLGRGAYQTLAQVRMDARSFGRTQGSGEEGAGDDYDLVDIGSLFTYLAEETGEPAGESPVLKALSELVICSYSNMDQANGVSLYYPQRNRRQYYDMREVYEALWRNTAYRNYLRAVGNVWQSAERKDWSILPDASGEEEYTILLTDEQQEEMISAHYSVLLSEHPGQYRPILLDCEIRPDKEGILHLSKDPSLMALHSGTDVELWPAAQSESTKKRRIYQTKNTTLCASGVYFYSRYNVDRDYVTVVLQEDVKTEDLSIQTVNSFSGDYTVDGRENINVESYDAICYEYSELIPTYGPDGGLLGVSSWKTGDYTGKISLNLLESFGFEKIHSSDFSGKLYYVVSITDVNGSEYLTEPFPIEPMRKYEIVREETPEGLFTAAVYPDHAELLSYEGTDPELEIPETFGGAPLTVIGPKAFFKRISMDYVGAGEHYPLKKVTIPDTVTQIAHAAFYMCADLEEAVLPKNLETIGTQAFAVCLKLPEIRLPESLESIGPYAFSDCWELRHIDLPKSVKMIGKGAFACCYALNEITLPAENEAYTVCEDGLYTKDLRTILAFPAAKTGNCTVREETEEIGADCFSGTNLSEVILPEGLKKIGNYAFYESVHLKMPLLPESLLEVGYNAFSREMMEFTEEFVHDKTQEIRIGKNLTTIRRGAFVGMIPRVFSVDPENPHFTEKDGALLLKSGDSLQEFAVEKMRLLEVPDGVKDLDTTILTQIGQYDVWVDKTTTDVYLPDSLIRISGVLLYRDSLVFHCSEGSTAARFAAEYGLQKSSDTEPVLETAEVPTEAGSLQFSLTESHAVLTMILGTDEEITVPEEVAGKPVTIIGSGEYSLYGKWGYFDAEGRDLERKIILPDTVEVIGDRAFSDVKLSEINLPDTVRVIGENAFGLIRKPLTALPKNLEHLGKEAFRRGTFDAGRELVLPESLKEIAPGAFSGIRTDAFSLESGASEDFRILDGMLVTADGKTILAGVSPEKLLTIPEGIEKIGPYAFANQNFTELVLPETLRIIEEYAFSGNFYLEQVHFAEGLQEVGAGNFTSGILEEVRLPRSCESIGENAFSSQSKLVSVSLNAKVIGKKAFSSCKSLREVDFGEELQDISDDAFLDSAPETFTLPKSLRQIGKNVFGTLYGEPGEDSGKDRKARILRIPENVREIGENCFSALEISGYEAAEESESFSSPEGLLTDKAERVLLSCPTGIGGLITLPESVFEIRSTAFAWCHNLSGIVIPDTVEVIRPFAFSDQKYSVQGEKILLYCRKDSPAALWAAENDWPWDERQEQ